MHIGCYPNAGLPGKLQERAGEVNITKPVDNKGITGTINLKGTSKGDIWFADIEDPFSKPDLKRAKELLAEAGYPDGFEIGLDCTNDRYVNDEKIGQAVASMWARIGVKPKLMVQSSSVVMPKGMSGKSDIWMFGWATLPMMDAYSVLAQILSSPREKLGVFNPGGYKNPKVDELIDKISVELDEPKRVKMISEAFKIAKEDVVLLPFHQQPLSWAVRDNVKIIQTGDNMPRLWYARVD